MRCARYLCAVSVLTAPVAAASASDVTDQLLIPLSQALITPAPRTVPPPTGAVGPADPDQLGGTVQTDDFPACRRADLFSLTELDVSDLPLSAGETYTLEIRFAPPMDMLAISALTGFSFSTDGGPDDVYEVDYMFSVPGSEKSLSWTGHAASVGGVVEVSARLRPPVRNVTATGVDLTLDFTSGSASWDAIDVALRGGCMSIVPEPGTGAMLAALALLARRQQRVLSAEDRGPRTEC